MIGDRKFSMVRMKRRSISKKESSGLQNLSQCLTKNVLFLKARAIRCCQMLSNVVVKCCCQMLLSNGVVIYCQMLSNVVVRCCCQMLLSNGVVKCFCQMLLSDVARSLMLFGKMSDVGRSSNREQRLFFD